MQRARSAAVFALLLFVFSSVPSFAIERQPRSPGEEGPIDRIIHVIRHLIRPIVHVLDQPTEPKP
jgi:hypothetical protein